MTRHRVRGVIISSILSALILVGCSTGTAPEAERGKQQDAVNESIISDMQATHTWELINSTPESTPEETPAP